ncbi:MAG: hypothetical protein ICV68_15090 [Pyrinomonadaceae bacterium]|nr:hypothetical protein [Pyrinomonadaceae bacterium]
MFAAHREHIYQRITPNPAKHRQVTNIYLGLSTLSGLATLLAAEGTLLRLLGGGVLILGCCLFMALLPYIAKEQDYR